MPKSFAEVYGLYRANQGKVGDMSLQDFSRIANYVTNSDEFSSGDVSGFGGAVKRGSYWLDRGLDYTGLPQAFGQAGQSVFEAFGADPTVGRQVGESLPRSIVNFLPLMAAAPVAAAASIPAAVATGLGLAATSGLSAAGAYEQGGGTSDVLAAAAAPAVGLGAMTAARPLVTGAVSSLSKIPGAAALGFRGPVTSVAPATAAQAAGNLALAEGAPAATKALTTIPERLAAYIGDNAAAIAGVEATQVAMTDKNLGDVFTKENILANVAGSIPFAVIDIPALAQPRVLDVQPVIEPRIEVAKTDPLSEMFAQRVVDYSQKSQALRNIKDKNERNLARVRLAEEYSDVLQDSAFTLMNRVKREEITKVAVENPQNVLTEVTKQLEALRSEIKNLKASEDVEAFVSTANALKETPIPQHQVAQVIENAMAKGSTPAEAAEVAANTVLNQVAVDPVKPATLRKKASADILRARAAGGAAGGRPRGQTEKNKERAAWADNWFKTTPEGQEAEKIFSKEYLQAEKRIPAGMPEELKLDMRNRMINAVGAFRDKVLNTKGWEAGKAEFAGYLRQTARDAWKPKASTEKHVDADGIVIKFDSLDSAKAEAERLNAELRAQHKNDEPPIQWVPAKLTRKTKDGKDRWRLQSTQNIRKVSIDAEGAPEIAAAPTGPSRIFQDMLDALSDKTGKALEPLRQNDKNGDLAALEQAYAAGAIKTPEDIQSFLSGRTKLKDVKETVIDVVVPKTLADELVGPPAPAPDATKPAPATKPTAPAETSAQRLERLRAQAERLKAEAAARNQAKQAVDEVLNQSKDPDETTANQVVVDEAIKFVKDITVNDLTTIVRNSPLMRGKLTEALKTNPDTSAENLIRIIEETLRAPGNLEVSKEFLAEVQAAKDLRAIREAQQPKSQLKPLKPTEEGKAEAAPESAPTSDQLVEGAMKQLRTEVGELPETAQKLWTEEVFSKAQKFLSTGDNAILEGLTKPMRSRILQIAEISKEVAAGNQEFRPLFAGVRGRGNMTALVKAEMASRGRKNYMQLSSPERTKIWRETGWMLGPDGKWRFEIRDQASEINVKSYKPGEYKLKDVLKHDELYKHYPQLADMPITLGKPELNSWLGYYDPNTKSLLINVYRIKNPQYARSVLLHEIQHAIQDIEGFLPGDNPRKIFYGTEGFGDRVQQLIEKGYTLLGAERVAKNEFYKRAFGEVEARQVQERAELTSMELSLKTPYGNYSGEGWRIKPSEGTKFVLEDGGQLEPMQFTLESLTRGVLERSGWSGEAIERVAMPLIKQLREVLPIDGVQFGRLVNDALIGGQELLGMSSINGLARRVYLGTARDFATRGRSEQLVSWSLNLAHEIGHNIEQAANNGLLSPEALQHRQGFRTWALENQSNWSGMLKEFADLLPQSVRNIRELQEMLQPKNVEEFEASSHALWAMGELVQRGDLELFAATSPTPVRDWFRSLAKWSRDLVGSIKSALFKIPTEASAQNREAVTKLTEYYQNIKEATNQAYKQMAESSEVLDVDSQSMSMIRASEVELGDDGVLRYRGQEARPNLVGPTPRSTGQRLADFASNSMVYLEQLAARYPRVGGLAYAVMNAPSTQKAFMSSAMEPIFGKYDPATGRTEIDPARKPLLKMLASGGRVERVVSDIYRWQNKNRMEFPLQNPASASPMLAQRLSVLTPQEQSAIRMWQEGQKRSLQVVNSNIVRMKASDGVHAIATALREMVTDKDALSIVTKALNAERLADPMLKQQAIAEWASELSTGDPAVDANNRSFVQTMVAELNTSVNNLQKNLDSRPWYTPEIRTGNFLLRSYDANGKQVSVDGYSTDAELAALRENAKKNGAVRFESKKRDRRYDIDIGEGMTSLLDTLDNTMVRKLQSVLPPALAGNAQDYVDFMNLSGELTRLSQAHLQNPTLPVRRLAEGRENLNMVTGWQHYINTMGRVLSNRLAQSKMRYELSAPELRSGEYTAQIEQVKKTFENYLTPDSEFAKQLTKWNAVYHLGFNLPTHIAELSQGLSTVLPQLVFETGSAIKGTKLLSSVGKELAAFYAKKAGGKAMGKDEWTKWGNLKEREMLEILARRGRMDNHAFLENLGDDVASNLSLGVTAQRNLVGETLNIAGAPLKAFADVSMNLYGSFARWNSRLAAIAGYRLAVEKGMTHQQAIEYADRFLVQTTFTSGRAGRPPEFYKNSNVGAMLYSLQRYALNWMSMYATHLKGAFADPQTLMDQQRGTRKQHAKALATMSLVQFGLAGALGMPFVSPLLTLLEDRLGLDIRGRAYKTLSDAFDVDGEEGGFMGDVVMRGATNALLERVGLPVDFGSRFNLSGLPGMNEFNGFDPGRVFGPTTNIANSAFKGISGMLTGDFSELSKSVAPVGLRKAIEFATHGDALTTKGTRLGLTDSEGMLYAFGLTPRRVSKTRDAERILENQRQERLAKTNKAADQIAQLLQSDPVAAREKFSQFVSEGLDAGMLQRDIRERQRAFAQQVAQAAVKQTFPKDIRRSVTAQDRQQASETLRAMGAQFPAPTGASEAQLANIVMRQLGQAPVSNRLATARKQDRMLEQLTAWQ